jgi:hypothetical protein
MKLIGKLLLLINHVATEMMNNMTLYPAHSDAQVANAANAYQHSDQNITPNSSISITKRPLANA